MQSKKSEIPTLSSSAKPVLKINLMEYRPVPNLLLRVSLGKNVPFNPTEQYQLLPRKAQKENKKFLIVTIGDRYIGFEAKIDKIGNTKFYSVNYPGYSITPKKEKLIVNGAEEGLFYIFETPDNGTSWRLAQIKSREFSDKIINCTYNKNGLMTQIILAKNVSYKIAYKNNLPVKVLAPGGTITNIKWNSNSHIKYLETLISETHPLHPKTKTQNNILKDGSCIIRSIHVECDSEGRLITLINSTGEKYSARYSEEMNKKTNEKIKSAFVTSTAINKYAKTIHNKKTHTQNIEVGYFNTNEKGKKVFTPKAEYFLKKKNSTLAIFSKTVDGRKTIFERNHTTMGESAEIDPMGYRTEFTRNEKGLKTKIKYPDGREKHITYNPENDRKIEETDGSNKKVSYKYASSGLLLVKNENGIITKYQYKKLSNDKTSLKTQLPDKTIHSFEYDKLFRITKHTKPTGVTTEYSYIPGTKKLNLTITKSPKTNQKWYEKFNYDEYGRLLSATTPDKKSKSYKYSCCQLTSVTDEYGAKTQYKYNAKNQLTEKILPNKGKFTYSYNNQNKLNKIVSPDNLVTEKEYDEFGNITKLIQPDETIILLEYNKNDKVTKKSYSDTRHSYYHYDEAGRMISVRGDFSRNYTYEYNSEGQLVKVTDHGLPYKQKGRTTHKIYDNKGRLEKNINPDNSTETIYYQKGSNRKIAS
ncbi:MAG: hypothetical protein U9O87_00005, partial [Verrucomicrobiota bacterium]|nr:hypothetical protein [Verrucomicrobiota bacterium]